MLSNIKHLIIFIICERVYVNEMVSSYSTFLYVRFGEFTLENRVSNLICNLKESAARKRVRYPFNSVVSSGSIRSIFTYNFFHKM